MSKNKMKQMKQEKCLFSFQKYHGHVISITKNRNTCKFTKKWKKGFTLKLLFFLKEKFKVRLCLQNTFMFVVVH